MPKIAVISPITVIMNWASTTATIPQSRVTLILKLTSPLKNTVRFVNGVGLLSEVRNEHDANHRKIHESNNCIVGLVLLLSHLGEHDLQRLIHNHEHEKQEVNGVVALSVIVLVLS